MQFDMNRTWSQAMTLVRANFQLLVLIAGIFLLLPGLIPLVAFPELAPPANEAVELSEVGQWLLDHPLVLAAALVTIVISFVGYSAMVALMGPQRPTVGAAIGQGARVLPTIVGCLIVLIAGYLVIGLLTGFILVGVGSVVGFSQQLVSALLALVLVTLMFYAGCRLSLTFPVVVLERTPNPVRAFARSWTLTAPARWRIVAFFLLLLICVVVIDRVVWLVLGSIELVIDADNGGRFLSGLLGGLIGMVLSMIGCGIVVSMHAQLADPSAEAIESFE